MSIRAAGEWGGGSALLTALTARQRGEHTWRAAPSNRFALQRVLATGQIANDRQEYPTVVQTVTVEVSTEQAQKLILDVGTMSLVLRQVGEAVPEAVRRITLADLGESEPAAAPAPPPAPPPAPSRVAEVWIYRGDTEPTIYRDVYREPYRKAR